MRLIPRRQQATHETHQLREINGHRQEWPQPLRVLGVLREGRKHYLQSAASIAEFEAGLAGRTATALAFRGREGRVRLGDSDWAARLPQDATEPAPGAVLRVVDVDGTVLIVRPET